MYFREVKSHELDSVYSMGFDAWNGGLAMVEYLENCRISEKYQSGVWYVLISDDKPVSSLIVYTKQFGLKEDCFGIGSVATEPEFRCKGYGSYLVSLVKDELLNNQNAKAIYLHSDIDHSYYNNLGFLSVQNTDCMCISRDKSIFKSSIPSYF